MTNFYKIFIATLLLLNLGVAKAEIDPRMKALGTMAVYGTVGGALLGTASLAFGTRGRAVAQGASLGLYAGILFGSFVVISHYTKNRASKSSSDYYPEAPPSPYEGEAEPSTYESFEGGEEEGPSTPFRILQFQYESDTRKLFDPFKQRESVPVSINFLNLSF